MFRQWLGGTEQAQRHPVAQRLFSWWLPQEIPALENACACAFARQPGRAAACAFLPDRQTVLLLELSATAMVEAASWEVVNPAGTFCFTRHGGIRLELPEPGGERLALRSRWLNLADNAALLGIYGGESWTLLRSTGVTGMSRDGFLWAAENSRVDCATMFVTGCPLALADALGRESAGLRANLPGEPAEQNDARAVFCTGRDGKNYLFAANLAPAPGSAEPRPEKPKAPAFRADAEQSFHLQLPGKRWQRIWPAAHEEDRDHALLYPGDCGLWMEE